MLTSSAQRRPEHALNPVILRSDPHAGSVGIAARPTLSPFLDRITVVSGGAGERSGLRSGDVIDLRTLARGTRARLYRFARAGEPIVLTINRNGTPLRVTILPDRTIFTWSHWAVIAGELWIVLFCALLVWRRSNSREVRYLVLFLMLVYVTSQNLLRLGSPGLWVNVLAYLLADTIFWLGVALLAAHASLFGRPLSTLRRLLAWAIYAGCALSLLLEGTRTISVWQGSADPFVAFETIADPFYIPSVMAAPLVLVSLFAAIGATRGPERTRVVWATVAIGPLNVWFTIAELFPILFPIYAATYGLGYVFTASALTYSLLNGRLVDLGFIVNRAAVFGAVSAVLLGVFVVVEWSLTDWLRGTSHVTNVLVIGGLALTLGLSMRFVHNRMDRLVDNVFSIGGFALGTALSPAPPP